MTFIEHMYYFNEEWNTPVSKEKLLKMGKCCALMCTNCPYSKPVNKGNKELE